jgi:hypothetical protein
VAESSVAPVAGSSAVSVDWNPGPMVYMRTWLSFTARRVAGGVPGTATIGRCCSHRSAPEPRPRAWTTASD